ncbi:mpv17-like protein 2 [Plakobranchus ocellatus]|uniref:Mpv17-like protein 2 n=1 Tax=Plakobranchus ocellatus TaxID=259542 RepID=A0AAV4CZ25_9GAST|nr:mpv17-like protein 2 [Plakobranchus ocellatus]
MAATVSRLRVVLDKLFTKHLFTTNVVTCGALLGVGDACVQGMNIAWHKKKDAQLPEYDLKRTGRMVVIGLALGPFNHFWYALLDKWVKGPGAQMVLKKICLDQAVAGPFFCSMFLSGTTILEGGGVENAKSEVKEKFLKIYMVDWCFWPMAQFINFKFLPTKYRVAYVSTATLIWNSFLSYMKHKNVPANEEHVH